MMSRTAVCFSGTAIALEYTYENLYQNLLSAFEDYDLFFYIKDDEDACKVEKYFVPTKIKIEKDIIVPCERINWDNRSRGSCQSHMNQLYAKKMVNQMRIQYEKDNGFEYETVVHSRLGIKYYQNLSMFHVDCLDMKYAYIPDFHNFPIVQGVGLNDRFIFSNRENMNIFFNLYDYFFEESKEGLDVHGESTLYRCFKKNNIKVKYLPFRFTRMSKDGVERDKHLSLDPSCWQSIERETVEC